MKCHDDLKMFDEAVTDLQAGKEPQEICQTLKFCTATDAPNKLMSGLLDFTGGDFLPSRCTTCQQNTLLLASLITRPDSLATFEHGINSVCRLIPESSEVRTGLLLFPCDCSVPNNHILHST
jgi:hypothetical protein